MNLHRFKTFETVYLFNTDYLDYSFTVSADETYGTLKITLWDERKAEFLIQSITTETDEQSMFRLHLTYGDNLTEDEFLKATHDFLYIFNKNQLNFKATLVKSKFDQHLSPYALFKVTPDVDIEQIERILATTKITNAKINPVVPIDKLVYQTAKGEGQEYEWQLLQKMITAYLSKWAKNDHTDLHAVLTGKKILPDWSDAQYKKGRKSEGLHDFYVLIEKLRQYQHRYE